MGEINSYLFFLMVLWWVFCDFWSPRKIPPHCLASQFPERSYLYDLWVWKMMVSPCEHFSLSWLHRGCVFGVLRSLWLAANPTLEACSWISLIVTGLVCLSDSGLKYWEYSCALRFKSDSQISLINRLTVLFLITWLFCLIWDFLEGGWASHSNP